MAILSKGTTYADGDQITSTNLNALVDSATFAAGAVANNGVELNGSGQLEVRGNIDIGTSNLTATGAISLGATTFNDNNITNVGSIAVDTIIADNTDVTIDAAGDIILDADGAQVRIKDGGTERFVFNLGTAAELDVIGDSVTIHSNTSDADIIFKGNDGGSSIDALTLDMSAAGAATFNDKITAVGTSVFTNLDISGDVDVDGTINLDAVDIDGNVQIDGTVTVGVDDTGHDVKFFGDTSGAYIQFDASADKLLTAGGATVDIVKDKLLIGGTAVTTTAAELNVLDGVTAGTVTASKGIVVDSNKDVSSFRNITLTGELDAGSLDVSGDIDVDGTANLDVVDIDGAVDMASTLTVATTIQAATAAGSGDAFLIGNDSKLVDIDVANTGGLYGTSTTTEGGLKLGSGGPTLYGKASNLGIGTASPANLLSIEASDTTNSIGNSAAAMRISNSSTSATGRTAELVFSLGQTAGLGSTNKLAAVTGIYESHDGSGARGALALSTASSYTAGPSEKMRILANGNVGIGTTNPGAKLEVMVPASEATTDDTLYRTALFGLAQANMGSLEFKSGRDDGAFTNRMSSIQAWSNSESNAVNLVLQPDGSNVGIGTTPSNTLHVKNTTSSGAYIQYDGQSNTEFGLKVESNVSGGNFEGDFANNGSLLDLFANSSSTSGGDILACRTQSATPVFLVRGNGRVGIGSAAPANALHVVGADEETAAINTATATCLEVAGNGTSSNSGGTVLFSAASGAWKFAAIKGLVVSGSTNTVGDLAFSTRSAVADATLTERMRIEYGGKVGIGTSAPAEKLDVVGAGRFSTGVTFGTDTAAANKLDDYEEGTFTPVLKIGGATAGISYGAAVGSYTKIGNLVNASLYVLLSSKGSATGSVTIDGLPFTSANTTNGWASAHVGSILACTWADYPAGYLSINSTVINPKQYTDSGGGSSISDSNLTDTSSFIISITYRV